MIQKIEEITVKELSELKNKCADFVLIDVREPYEYEACHLGGKLIPLQELPNHLHELNPDQLTIVHCQAGGRSSRAVQFLMQSGFSNVKNLKGGLSAWRDEIDPTLPR